METDTRKNCFVIMPFGPKTDPNTQKTINFDEVYQYIIRPALEDALKLKVTREDLVNQAGWIHRDMITHILNDDVAVVDISFLNPNVFYELGVRHALRKSVTVIMKEKETKIPFNIQGMRIIEYGMGLREADEAKRSLINFIRSGLDNQRDDSLVYDVFPDLRVSRNRE
jgi:hypothetical protein